MSARPAKRSLVEPDYWTCPHGVRGRPQPGLTYGPEVADLNDKAGYTPDPQQELGLDLLFAIRPDGSPATFAFCVICARQNLKSGLFLQAVIGWTFVMDDVPEIAWSAHELKTALGAQRELLKILESPVLSKYLLPARANGVTPSLITANGQERIELTTGQKIWFQTRTRDGGRGLGKPKLILDEAMKLKSRMMAALLPILLAQHHPQVCYGSSAPPYEPDAMQLRDVMKRGRKHTSPELSYLEWLATREPCADPDCTHPKDALVRGIDCALDREHLIRQANPTLTTGRITLRTIRNLRQELDPLDYMRECMGWADDPAEAAGPPAINLTAWSRLANPEAPAPARIALVLDVEPDRSASTIGLAGATAFPDPVTGVAQRRILVMHQTRPGIGWVAGAVEKLKANAEVLEVALHPAAEAKILIPKLKAKGIEYHKLTHQDMTGGCSGFQTAIADETIVQLGQVDLDAAVTVARAPRGQWDRANSPVPQGPLVAVSVAEQRWEFLDAENPPTPPPAPRRARTSENAPRAASSARSIQTVNF